MASFKFTVLVCLALGISIKATMPSQITELTDQNFNDYAKGKEFLLVDFFAPWCSDSKALAPELEKAAYTLGKRSSDVAKVDCFGKGKRLCANFQVKRWPTLKTFRHGALTAEYTGAHHAEAVANYVNGAEDIIQDAYYAGLINAASSKTKTPAAATAAASPPAMAPGGLAVSVEDEGTAIETEDNETPLPSGDAPIISTPEEVIPIAPLANDGVLAGQKSEKAAYLPQGLAPTSETINALECAKCRIMSPAQAKLTPNCRGYKRSCLPGHNADVHPVLQVSMNMLPRLQGKKRGRRYARFFGLRK